MVVWDLDKFNSNKPKDYEANYISKFLSFLDRQKDDAEIIYDEAKDQLSEQLDFVILEKKSSSNCSVAEAKLLATNDERYMKAKKEYRDKKKIFLYWKSLAKNGHSHCDHLKQQNINQLAIDKLSR
jgi:hypothetical protein